MVSNGNNGNENWILTIPNFISSLENGRNG